MTKALTKTYDHLYANRGLILGRSLAASLVGLVPVPYVSDLLPALVKRDLVRRIADSRGVDIDEAAVRMIAEGEVPRATWKSLISATPLLSFLRQGFRRLLVAWSVYRQAEGATRTFAMATLFDHYCARLHVGGELGLADARALRMRIEAAVKSPAGGLAAWTLRQIFFGALAGVARAPAALAEAIGKVRQKRLRPPGEVEAEEIAEEAIAAAEDSRSPLGKAARAVEQRLGLVGRAYLDGLVDAFERSGAA